MRYWSTTVKAICPLDGELKEYGGIVVQAISRGLARCWCQDNGYGYLHVGDELIGTETLDGDRVDYKTHTLN